jgi:predicted DNA-binding ribbon-helix-helix protein
MSLRKRSFRIDSRRRSVAVEPRFWTELQTLATEREMKLGELIETVRAESPHQNLASSLRVYAILALKEKSKALVGACGAEAGGPAAGWGRQEPRPLALTGD